MKKKRSNARNDRYVGCRDTHGTHYTIVTVCSSKVIRKDKRVACVRFGHYPTVPGETHGITSGAGLVGGLLGVNSQSRQLRIDFFLEE